jgi:flagellar basal-body rod protein FlgG
MMSGLYAASTAMEAFQTSLDTTANNLANADTTAFKASEVNFQDLFYSGPDNLQVGNGVQVADILPDFTQGPIETTDQNLDLAVNGNGFFAVKLPDGTINYTRDGTFQQDALGRLVTGAGNIVQPPITFPSDTLSITISSAGVVSVVRASAPNQTQVLGQITLANFPNPDGLLAGAGNLYSPTPDSGAPATAIAGTNGLGTIQQYAIEQSNVNVTNEMANLASEQQGFVANSHVLTTADEMVTSALSIVH